MVDSSWKRRKTAEMIAGNRQVTKIVNHLAIVPTNSAADKKIAVSLVDIIYDVDGAGSDNVNVRVSDGVITLTGVVSTIQTRRTAGMVAGGIAGVYRVSNQLVVAKG